MQILILEGEVAVALEPSKTVLLHADDILFQRQTGRSRTFVALLMTRYLYSISLFVDLGPLAEKMGYNSPESG